MTNDEFLAKIDSETKREILENIATNYGISTEEALDEISGPECEEHLLDYLTGGVRVATSLLWKRLL